MLVYQRVVIYIPSFCNHFSPTPGSSYETHADPTLMLLTVKAYGTPGTTRPRSRPRARRPWREKWHAVTDITACGHDQINLNIYIYNTIKYIRILGSLTLIHLDYPCQAVLLVTVSMLFPTQIPIKLPYDPLIIINQPWLVVSTNPSENDGVRQLGWWHSRYMEKPVPNHQPVYQVVQSLPKKNINHPYEIPKSLSLLFIRL